MEYEVAADAIDDASARDARRDDGRQKGGRERVEAVVIGHVRVDFHPAERDAAGVARTFARFVGGYGASVATGLARLRVRSMLVSGVGDDAHGAFVRSWLAAEGVDVSGVRTHPTLRTPLAFEEDNATGESTMVGYGDSISPDGDMRSHDMPIGAIRGAPIAYVTGTGLAREPGRTATLLALEPRARRPVSANRWTIFDLDWQESEWRTGGQFPMLARAVAGAAEVVVGNHDEWRAADLRPLEALGLGVRLAVVKGDGGATVYDRGGETRIQGVAATGQAVGPGQEAFAAALGAALLAGSATDDAVRRSLAAAAAVAGRRCGSAGMPTAEELDARPGDSEPRPAEQRGFGGAPLSRADAS